MTLGRSALTLGIMLAMAAAAGAVELHGKVAGVMGKDVRLTVEGDMLPQLGDVVTIEFEIPGGTRVVVGTWRVTAIDGDSVVASQLEATGTPAIDQLATIESANPSARRPRQPVASATSSTGDSVRVSYQGQVYETVYQHQKPDGNPIDVYFFVAPGAGAGSDGMPRYNRFVREPAEGDPATPTWWFCQWLLGDEGWRYDQAKGGGVTVLRTPVDAAALEGSVWHTTSTETGGDRKGQSFSMEVTLTTANGITRLSSSTTYAEGRIVGDRFTFSTFEPDGSGPVGEGWCVFSGTTFSGGWTATNGRAGIWEGRRLFR